MRLSLPLFVCICALVSRCVQCTENCSVDANGQAVCTAATSTNEHSKQGRMSVTPYGLKGPIAWELLAHSVKNDFTMNGQVEVDFSAPNYMYHNEILENKYKYPESIKQDTNSLPEYQWTNDLTNELLYQAEARDVQVGRLAYGTSAAGDVFNAVDVFREKIQGKNVLVFGSLKPWVESIMYAYGYAHTVTTVEYNTIHVDRTDIFKTYTVEEFQLLENVTHSYDVIVSFSSIEHDGLGRYGDPINPHADIYAMRSFKQLLTPGGLLLLAVPSGGDRLLWNRDRIYGPVRWAKLTQGWRTVACFCGWGITDTFTHPDGRQELLDAPYSTNPSLFNDVLTGKYEKCTLDYMGTQPLWVLTPE
eukprot:GDKI01019116.1.p1 GENE.GDKI01019116.1~~GDKI01019116.1.p1  ORF type:complete len:361 (-),score=33.27 GDKI01019116.1:44-1126(-)